MKNKLLHVLMLTSALSVTFAFASEERESADAADALPNQAVQILLPPEEDELDVFSGESAQQEAQTVPLTDYNELLELHNQLQTTSQQEVADLTEELNDLRGNLGLLRGALDAKESELEAQSSVISALRANVADLQAANAQWATAYSKLKEKQKTVTPTNSSSLRKASASIDTAGSIKSKVQAGSNDQDLGDLSLTGNEQSGSGGQPHEGKKLTKEDKIQFIVRNMPRDKERTKKINDLTFTVTEKALEKMYQAALVEDEEDTTA